MVFQAKPHVLLHSSKPEIEIFDPRHRKNAFLFRSNVALNLMPSPEAWRQNLMLVKPS
jgi:hypothetical protein